MHLIVTMNKKKYWRTTEISKIKKIEDLRTNNLINIMNIIIRHIHNYSYYKNVSININLLRTCAPFFSVLKIYYKRHDRIPDNAEEFLKKYDLYQIVMDILNE